MIDVELNKLDLPIFFAIFHGKKEDKHFIAHVAETLELWTLKISLFSIRHRTSKKKAINFVQFVVLIRSYLFPLKNRKRAFSTGDIRKGRNKNAESEFQ